jgi:glycosyltransferase involved in cell wall biosynthesis
MPKFSVVIPCYNASQTIEETLKSIQKQTLSDLEIICVDDGSTDYTVACIVRAAEVDPRIKLFAALGKGPSDARNQGALKHAAAGIVAFCDADDLWHAGKLEDLAATFEDPSVHGAFGGVEFFTAEMGDGRSRSQVPQEPLSIEMLIGENPVCTMSNMTVRREVFAASGGFDARMVHNEDLEWLIRLVGQGAKVVGCEATHTFYRTSTRGLSADLDAMKEARKTALATARRFDVEPTAQGEAIHFRYLARRALRLGQGRASALRMVLMGLRSSPTGFLFPIRRGGATLLGAALACVLPRRLSLVLFAR